MQYAMLIYASETEAKKRTAAEQGQLSAEYGAFSQEMGRNGKLKGGEPLESSTTATTVRVRNGKTVVTDGPFAETKEQLGGFMLIEANDLDEAIAIAARIPSSKHGTIEVRPVMKRNM
jgi:hypothetical protein